MPEYRMGASKFYYDGLLQDYLTQAVSITATPTYKSITGYDQIGDAPWDDALIGANVEVKMTIAVPRSNEAKAKFIPWAKVISDGAKSLIDGVVELGKSMRETAKPILFHPVYREDSDVTEDFYIPLAACTSPFELKGQYNNEDVYEAAWKGYIENLTTMRLFQIGDRTAAADTIPPTVSSTSPTAAATGVSKGAGLNIDFVMSEDINPATVIKANTLIQKTSDLSVFANYSVSYISATKTIRIATTAALSATTEYAVSLLTGVKDLSGNALVTVSQIKFTTGA